LKKVIVMDGVEWRRQKWDDVAKLWFWYWKRVMKLLMAEGATDVICFLLQQSVEKLLKAYLQVCEVAFPLFGPQADLLRALSVHCSSYSRAALPDGLGRLCSRGRCDSWLSNQNVSDPVWINRYTFNPV
jgi:hypothetical protein